MYNLSVNVIMLVRYSKNFIICRKKRSKKNENAFFWKS